VWLEQGRIAAGLGRRAEAIAALRQVRTDFAARGIPYDAALATLDLAVLLLEEGASRRSAFNQRDIRFAWTLLGKHALHATITVLALALGIGLTATMFSVVHGIFLKALPFRDSNRIVQMDCSNPKAETPLFRISRPKKIGR
jgi:hypothetical protein